ncbi:MAG: NUDIX hydrolase [Gemmataceae bacterium]|nr:NUDIX hydrolase [Gemmataceae bacterium]MDW8263959.1 NUDIX hydrolase [Gemmataceae bacterium]
MPRQVLYQGRKIQVALDIDTLPDGRSVRRDVVLHPGAVVILPVVDGEHVCLLRNQRPAVGQVLWELPAGTLEPGEPPEHAAARELAEETGYRAGRWTSLGHFYPSPGVLSEVMHLFVAEELHPGPMNLEPGEELHPQIVPFRQAVAWALDGTIRDAKTVIGLLLWERRR